jgi:N-acyl-D-amino-acid deacylase
VSDLLLANALVVDGTGRPGALGSVLVRNERIAAVIAPGQPHPAVERRFDAAGDPAPGFVDAHSHSDMSPFVRPSMDSLLRQGATTLVVGNCGLGLPSADAEQVLGSPGRMPAT